MTSHARPVLAFVAAVCCSIGCADPTPPVTALRAVPVDTTSLPSPSFPAVTRSAAVYRESTPLYAPLLGSGHATRYVLYDDGSFAIQFASARNAAELFEYPGRWAVTGSSLTLAFDANPTEPWIATAVLRGDSLDVSYNSDMVGSDFIDGTYVLESGPPVTVHTPPLTVPTTPEFPALTRSGVVYVAAPELYASVGHDIHLQSRYALYDDGTFELQFVGAGQSFQYLGRWTRADSLVTFDWDGWSLAGPWGATGALEGDRLVVKYNSVMMMSDFVDGAYVRSPAAF